MPGPRPTHLGGGSGVPGSRVQVSLSAGGLGLGGWAAPDKGRSGDEKQDRVQKTPGSLWYVAHLHLTMCLLISGRLLQFLLHCPHSTQPSCPAQFVASNFLSSVVHNCFWQWDMCGGHGKKKGNGLWGQTGLSFIALQILGTLPSLSA